MSNSAEHSPKKSPFSCLFKMKLRQLLDIKSRTPSLSLSTQSIDKKISKKEKKRIVLDPKRVFVCPGQ